MSIQKVEIVVPAIKSPPKEYWLLQVVKLGFLAFRTLIVFWFMATWFPELGLTFWQLVLPVWIATWLFRPNALNGRFIPSERLVRTWGTTEFAELGRASKA